MLEPAPRAGDDLRRIAYGLAGGVAAVSFGVVWWLKRNSDVFILFAHPVYLVLVLALLWMLWRRVSLPLFERFALLGMGSMMLVKYAYYFIFAPDLYRVWFEVESSTWNLLILMVLGYISFTPKTGLRYALVLSAFALAAGGTRLIGDVLEGQHRDLLGNWLRDTFRLFLLTGLLYWLASIKERVAQMQQQARQMALHAQHMSQKVEQMTLVAQTDGLTGLPNRESVMNRIKELMVQQAVFTVAILDLDHFKQVNDRFGHLVGDHVLRGLAERARPHLSDSVWLGRIGGEEFLLLFEGKDLAASRPVCEAIRHDLGHTPFPEAGKVTASFGLTEYRLGDDLSTLLRRADEALYDAKARGRNQVVLG